MKKKVLVIESQIGKLSGAPKVTLNIVDIFVSLGYEVYSLVPYHGGDIRKEYEKKKVSILNYHFPNNIDNRCFDSKGKVSKVKHLIFVFFKLIPFYIQAIFYCIKYRIDIVYCYDPRGLFFAFPIAFLLRRKLIWHLHGQLHIGSFFFKVINFFCDRIVVPSSWIAENLPPSNKIITIYNGYSFDDTPQLIRKTNNKKTIVCFVGVFSPQKGLHILLEALGQFDKDILLNIVGDINSESNLFYKDYVDSLIKKLPPNISIHYHGWISSPLGIIGESDLLVFPSQLSGEIVYNDKVYKYKGSEALPTVVIESLAMGVPVICNAVPGVSEIVTKSSGIVSTFANGSELAIVLHKFISCRDNFIFDCNSIKRKFSFYKMKISFRDMLNSLF